VQPPAGSDAVFGVRDSKNADGPVFALGTAHGLAFSLVDTRYRSCRTSGTTGETPGSLRQREASAAQGVSKGTGGCVPDQPGDRVELTAWTLEVTSIDGNAITSVQLRRRTAPTSPSRSGNRQ
jgi:hypothetical protein